MFTRIITSALLAGAGAGFIASLLQLGFVQPVLLHAELYESGQLVHFGSSTPISGHQEVDGFDALRDGLSIAFTIAIYCGYALILVAAMALATERGAIVTARNGIIWGIAGFIVVHLAPGFSLAPEVPGVAAADITARRVWWFATVGTAAIAVWLIGFGKSWIAWGIAATLLVIPHVIGAPEPDTFAGPAPTEIGALFASRALGIGLAAWVLVGLFAGYFWSREVAEEQVS